MDALVMAGQLILGLSILVGLHELGHLVAAKAFGMRVEQYSIGFPPKLFGVRYGETEYSFGAIPLGGFVKISGMVDESLDKEQLKRPPEPWEFRSKPAWQRLIVMVGGIFVNVVTGIVIFVGLVYFNGERYLPAEEARYGIVASELAQEVGLQTGDQIVAINGQSFDRFDDLQSADVLLGTDTRLTVVRDGERQDVALPNDLIDRISDRGGREGFLAPITPFQVGEVIAGQPAAEAGLQEGDRIVAIDGEPIEFFHEYQAAAQDVKGRTVPLTVARDGERFETEATFDDEGRLGFYPDPQLEYATRRYSLLEAFPKGTYTAFNVVAVQINAFGKMFRGEIDPSKSLAGPIEIAKQFGGTWDWLRFWSLVGLLSMVLAFMNFLPIPALDGGHVAFLTYEIVSGRKPSDSFLEQAQKVGMILLLSIMAYAIFNDIFKNIF